MMKLNLQSPKLKKYEGLEQLGCGAYGTVFKASLKTENGSMEDDKFFALKIIKLQKPEEGIPSTALREIAILKEFSSHPNIVKIKEVITEPEAIILVFQFCDEDLKQYMSTLSKQVGMDPMIVKSLCYQLLKGIHYCHSMKVLHRDLKPQNLLINRGQPHLILKIADFGLARGFALPSKGFAHQVVTLWYRPPDVLLESKEYRQNIDVWGIGCIFAEMATLRPIFAGSKEEDQLNKIFRILGTPTEQSWPGVTSLPGWGKFQFENNEPVNLSNIMTRLDADGIDLLSKMLQMNPEKRITIEQALNHPYFRDLPEGLNQIYEQKKVSSGMRRQFYQIKGTPQSMDEDKTKNKDNRG